MTSGVRKIIPLTLGWVELPKSVSVYGVSPELRLREPVPGILLQTDGGWVLLDTGYNTALIRDPALYERYYPSEEEVPVLSTESGEPLLQALDAAGVDLDDIRAIAVSHLHDDHSGGLKLFAGRVPVHIQRRELDYAMLTTPEAETYSLARINYDDPRIDWKFADGEAEIAPGITAIPTYGHTPGHQSFRVDLDESVGGGGFVFAFDAADLTENIESELAIGGVVGISPMESIEPIRQLKKVAADHGYALVPGHDPQVWPAFTEQCARRFT